MRYAARLAILVPLLLCATPAPALAAGWDLLLFLGRAYPRLEDRLSVSIPPPSISGVDVTVDGDPRIDADGGLVLGAALAVEAGVIGIEGRLDSVDIDFDVTGARFDLLGVEPPLTGLTGSLTLADGRLDVERLNVLSLNLRVRTPGPVGIVVSGGVSYLPSFTVGGSVPVTVVVDSPLGGISAEPRLRLIAAPQESDHRVGVNAGAGLRIGAGRLAVVADARVFSFGDYELRFAADDDTPFVDALVSSFDPVRAKPIIVTAQAGLLIRF
jgi:hypothetical protein